ALQMASAQMEHRAIAGSSPIQTAYTCTKAEPLANRLKAPEIKAASRSNENVRNLRRSPET
ncbi:MAG TPA: hypothetical protein PKE16_10715, partial [Hyphomicrobium sp.]|nr:hypothetical protein [Hyphomicrobium sp.]